MIKYTSSNKNPIASSQFLVQRLADSDKQKFVIYSGGYVGGDRLSLRTSCDATLADLVWFDLDLLNLMMSSNLIKLACNRLGVQTIPVLLS